MNRAFWMAFCLAFVVALLSGCGSSKNDHLAKDQLSYHLKLTGIAYYKHLVSHQKGPANWDELIASAKASGEAESIQYVRDAKYDLKWNVNFADVKDGLASTVLGEKTGSSLELMMDGSIREEQPGEQRKH